MIEIEFKDDEISGGLSRLQAALTDLTPVMQDLGEYFVDSTKQRFMAGTAPDGSPWAPKSEATKATYRRRGDKVDDRPLFGPSGALSSGIFHRAGSDSVAWGSSRIYAGVMQFGAAQGQFGAAMGRTRPSEKRASSQDYFSPIPWGDIPARPFLGLSSEDRDVVLEEIAEWLERSVTGP